MFFGEENIKAHIRSKKPDISNQELEKFTAQICEIALFWVRFRLKQHSKAIEKPKEDDLEQKSGEPP